MGPFVRYTAIAVMLFSYSCKNTTEIAPETPCIDESKINPNAICTMEYAPVCGCDGVTYGNACQAENNGVTRWEEGECN